MADLPPHRSCGAFDVHATMLATNPDYAMARLAIEAQLAATIEARAAMGGAGALGPTLIPVVVHIIHRGGRENISDQQIKSQIDVLNRDFRKKNLDVSKVPAPFSPLAADAGIEFALASRDPDGAPTTGITRTQTTVARFGPDNKMKFTAQGGHDAWDTARYLNIWVCPELNEGPSTLLGYAQFPGGLPATDGVVVVHNGFGTTGTAVAPQSRPHHDA